MGKTPSKVIFRMKEKIMKEILFRCAIFCQQLWNFKWGRHFEGREKEKTEYTTHKKMEQEPLKFSLLEYFEQF